jgi:trigger factor
MEFEQLLQLQDVDPEEFEKNAAGQAEQSVKAQLVLDQLARTLEVKVEPTEVDQEIHRQAMIRGVEPGQIAQVIQQQGTLTVLVSDIMRRKAIDALVEAADVEGGPDDAVLIELGLKRDPETPSIDVARTVGDIQRALDEQAAAGEG